MKMKKSYLGMAVLAGALFSMSACAGKTENQNNAVAPTATEEAEAPEAPAADPVEAIVEEWAGGAEVDSVWTTTPSGLKYKVIKKGEGRMPAATDRVLVNYEGKLTNGQKFDSSYDRNAPIAFGLNQVIPGWTEGVQLMPEGSEYIFYIPYQLAYGEYGNQAIPPKSDLLFKVELIEIQ